VARINEIWPTDGDRLPPQYIRDRWPSQYIEMPSNDASSGGTEDWEPAEDRTRRADSEKSGGQSKQPTLHGSNTPAPPPNSMVRCVLDSINSQSRLRLRNRRRTNIGQSPQKEEWTQMSSVLQTLTEFTPGTARPFTAQAVSTFRVTTIKRKATP
jgi:hypothetical protein